MGLGSEIRKKTYSRSRIQGSKRQRILYPGSGSATKNWSIFYPRELMLKSRKYDPGCSSQDPDFFPSRIRIPDSWVKKNTGFRSWIRKHCLVTTLKKANYFWIFPQAFPGGACWCWGPLCSASGWRWPVRWPCRRLPPSGSTSTSRWTRRSFLLCVLASVGKIGDFFVFHQRTKRICSLLVRYLRCLTGPYLLIQALCSKF